MLKMSYISKLSRSWFLIRFLSYKFLAQPASLYQFLQTKRTSRNARSQATKAYKSYWDYTLDVPKTARLNVSNQLLTLRRF